jgi:hypothetical protein
MTTPIPKKQLDECAAEIAKSSVPFYTISQGKGCQERSGVLFRIAERHFILTCAHGIKNIYKKHGFPAYIGPLVEESGHPIRLVDCPIILAKKSNLDLAVIELTNDVVERLLPTNRFISVAEMDMQAIARPACYLISGFPSEGTTQDDTGHGVKTLGMWYVTLLHRGELNPDSEYDQNIHLILHFGRQAIGQDGTPSDVPQPHGLSGCGIWRLTNEETWENWKPEDAKLVAIQHRWGGRHDYVIGSWVRLAIQMVWHRYEELRPALQIVIPAQG